MQWRSAICLCALAVAPVAGAAVAQISEGFEDVGALADQGWVFQNSTENPYYGWTGDGAWDSWVVGDGNYMYADYESTSASFSTTISNWMLTPELVLNSNSVVSFITTSGEGENGERWADRLQVRLSTSGPSTVVGLSAEDVGDFQTVLLDINPDLQPDGYPINWTQYQIPLSFLSEQVTGRIAFRYYVPEGGDFGTNSFLVAVDNFSVVPEPTAGAILMGVSALGLTRRRKA